MAILDANEIFFTAFEPKQANRFILYMDGVPSYIVKGVNAVTLTQGEVVLNHINVYRKVKGKTVWGDIQMTLFDTITPSGAQAVMEWVRLHHESLTGRDGYSSDYKRDIEFYALSAMGEKIENWTLKGTFISDANFGQMDWGTEEAMTIELTLKFDYAIHQY